jgi:hypothetical protein
MKTRTEAKTELVRVMCRESHILSTERQECWSLNGKLWPWNGIPLPDRKSGPQNLCTTCTGSLLPHVHSFLYHLFLLCRVSSYALVMEAADSSKTPAHIYQTLWCQIPENSNIHCHENLRSHNAETKLTLCTLLFLYNYFHLSFKAEILRKDRIL